MKQIILDEKRIMDAEKIAEVLSQLPPRSREIVINQMNVAIATCSSFEYFLKEGA